MHLNCPHCHNPIEIVDDDSVEVPCPSCGSSIDLEPIRAKMLVGDEQESRRARRRAEAILRDEEEAIEQEWIDEQDVYLDDQELVVEMVGRFECLELLGEWSFGTVWKARDPELGIERMILHQLLNDEPRPSRQLNDQVPRDLDTIAIKCLQKNPGRRYASAADLSADLRRWLTGHPIAGHPLSCTERAWRWCQRNPVVASLVTTAAILLMAVAVISTVSAVQLKNLADREHNETLRANRETENAQRERSKALELATTNATLAEQEQSVRKTAEVAAVRLIDLADRNAEAAMRQTKLADRRLYVTT